MSEEILYRTAFFLLLGAVTMHVVSNRFSHYPWLVMFCIFFAIVCIEVAIIRFLFDFIGGSSRD